MSSQPHCNPPVNAVTAAQGPIPMTRQFRWHPLSLCGDPAPIDVPEFSPWASSWRSKKMQLLSEPPHRHYRFCRATWRTPDSWVSAPNPSFHAYFRMSPAGLLALMGAGTPDWQVDTYCDISGVPWAESLGVSIFRSPDTALRSRTAWAEPTTFLHRQNPRWTV